MTKRSPAPWLWAAPALALLLGFGLWPLVGLARISLMEGGGRSGFGIGSAFYEPGTWTLAPYLSLGEDQFFKDVAIFTLSLGVSVAAICVLLGWPLAHFIWTLRGKWKFLALSAVVAPKLSNLLVTIYGLKFILDDYGALNSLLLAAGLRETPLALHHNLAGVVIGKVLLVLPYTVLLIWAGLERIDRRLVEAARGLGASRASAFLHVTLPLSAPALGTAALVSLIWGLGAYVSPFLLGSPQEITLAVDVQRQMFENLNWPRAAAEGMALTALLAILCGFFALVRWLLAIVVWGDWKGGPA